MGRPSLTGEGPWGLGTGQAWAGTPCTPGELPAACSPACVPCGSGGGILGQLGGHCSIGAPWPHSGLSLSWGTGVGHFPRLPGVLGLPITTLPGTHPRQGPAPHPLHIHSSCTEPSLPAAGLGPLLASLGTGALTHWRLDS